MPELSVGRLRSHSVDVGPGIVWSVRFENANSQSHAMILANIEFKTAICRLTKAGMLRSVGLIFPKKKRKTRRVFTRPGRLG